MPGPTSGRAHDLPSVLLRDLQHRTANLLNIACLQLEVHARRTSTVDSQAALQTVATTFRQLIEANRRFTVPDMNASADAAREVRATFEALARAYATSRPGVRFDCVIDADARFSVRPAGVLALIVNELVTNAFKHAFRHRDTGFLLVTLAPAGHGKACLSVVDDGPGFHGLPASPGSGMGLVAALAAAIDGEVVASGTGRAEGKVRITFRPEPDADG